MDDSILGLKGISTPTYNVLLAAYGNDMVNLATGLGYGLALTPGNNVEMETLMGGIFFQNGVDRPLFFNGTAWTTQNVARPPLGKLIRVWRSASRIYVANVTINGKQYPSRVQYADLPVNNGIQWGFEYGNQLTTTAGSPTVGAANAGFLTYNIKIGDPFFIQTGADKGQYTVLSVDADQQITLTTPLTTTASGIQFWAGGNWFDVGPDDSDYITWMEINNDQLMVFKRDTLYQVQASDGSQIHQVRGAYGTTSGRSVQNLHEITIYWYQGVGLSTAFYAYNGLYSQKISAPIDNHIAAMTQQINPVAWREGELYRCFLGNLFDQTYDIDITNAVATWDYTTKTWSIDPIDDIPVVTDEFRQNVLKNAYFGTNESLVMVTPQGNTYNGNPTPFSVTLSTVYPQGPAVICVFTRIQVISHDMRGSVVQARRHLDPMFDQEEFMDVGQISAERTEFKLLMRNFQSAGLEIRIMGIDGMELTGRIDKVIVFYKAKTTIVQ